MAKLMDLHEFHGSKTKTVLHGKLPDTPLETIDIYLKELKEHQIEWAQKVPLSEKIELLEQVLHNIELYKDDWATADIAARHLPEGHPEVIGSYLAGPAAAAHDTRITIDILRKLEANGGKEPLTKAWQDGDRVVVKSFPLNIKDQLTFMGWQGEIHLEKGTKLEDLPDLQARYYKDNSYEGGVSLLLMAGNVSSIAIYDLYFKLLNEKKVVIIKIHPVLEYMGSILNHVLAPLIDRGFVRIAVGGAVEGKHLTHHPLVDDIHITGSDKTFEAIVYGGGELGEKHKEMDHRLNTKPITGELGNVTPVIVVPGDWKESDFDFQADNIFCMLSFYNGYTCATARVLILPRFWEGSAKLLAKLEERMANAAPPANYYPGTDNTVSEALSCYPDMEKFGELNRARQPWMFAKNLDADKEEVAFNREFWASFLAQVFIDERDTEEYLKKAVEFANDKLWGTLAASIVVDPKTEKMLKKTGAFQKAIDDLRYGTVVTNTYPGFATALGANPWGGYPGSTYQDIQSGNVFVNNPLMLDKIEKSVVYSPFRISPKPIWFQDKNPNIEAGKAMMDFFISYKMTDYGRMLYRIIKH